MSKTIMVIDDDKDILEMISSILGDQFEVITASHAEEAFNKIKKQFVDLVLCDINLGSENGLKLMESLQNNLVDIPFIVISGEINEKRTEMANQLGAMGIIEKPFEYNELMQVIEKCLDPVHRIQHTRSRRQSRSAV